MADINKTSIIKTYGIDDDNFIAYLNKFKTFKNMINTGNTTIIPVDKLKELYYLFVYYCSLGYNLDTIVNETTNKVKKLFFNEGNEFFQYDLIPVNSTTVTGNYSRVIISGNICQIRTGFTSAKQLNKDVTLFSNIPSPVFEFRDIIYTNSGNKAIRVNGNGIMAYDVIPASNTVNGSITYIFDI